MNAKSKYDRVGAALQQANRALQRIKTPPKQHFWSVYKLGFRYGAMHCWCGGSIETSEPVRDLNRWLQEHEECRPAPKE